MARYTAEVSWRLQDGEDFARGRYSRGHQIAFDGGVVLPGSASAHVVGNRWAVEAAADPEEMLVAALSACHMLTFLHKARLAGHVVTAYSDAAEGVMEDIAPGRQAVTQVTLRPALTWKGPPPTEAALAALHHAAHEECFIANSVTTKILVEPR